MAETSQDLNQRTPGTTTQTPDTTPNCVDSIIALPLLSEQKGPISLTLTIDRSVGKIAAWAMAVIVGMAALIGAGIVLCIVMIIEWRSSQMEARVKTQEIIYLQAAVLAHGIPIPHPPGNNTEAERPRKE
jgi:hypothetical protein